MIHHTKAVARGASNALIVGDMPFMSYQTGSTDALRTPHGSCRRPARRR